VDPCPAIRPPGSPARGRERHTGTSPAVPGCPFPGITGRLPASPLALKPGHRSLASIQGSSPDGCLRGLMDDKPGRMETSLPRCHNARPTKPAEITARVQYCHIPGALEVSPFHKSELSQYLSYCPVATCYLPPLAWLSDKGRAPTFGILAFVTCQAGVSPNTCLCSSVRDYSKYTRVSGNS
jgi:hypothetical protein